MTVGVCFLTPRTKSEVLCAALNRKFQGPVDFEKRKSPRAPLAHTHNNNQSRTGSIFQLIQRSVEPTFS